jgi:predicted metal-dependent hydrolase
MIWPPEYYTVKKDARARRVLLKVSTRHGLEVIVPLRHTTCDILSVLENNREWIEKQNAMIQAASDRKNNVPTEIVLSAIDQIWQVHSMQDSRKSIRIVARPTRELVLLGNLQDTLGCKKALAKWVRAQGVLHLIPWLERLSLETELPFKTVNIRSQEARWGSCSSSKAISLNDKLLFLPDYLVSHVLIHELCHTIYPNHSPRFWKLVARFDPGCDQHRRALRCVDQSGYLWMP